jgi:hypothetical protein
MHLARHQSDPAAAALEREDVTLLEGEPGRPHNFRFAWMKYNAPFRVPQHRHNFEQVRLTLTGMQRFGRVGRCGPGDVGYFPEGTPYGPQTVDAGSVVINIAFGGPSGSGFVSDAEVAAARENMKSLGEFKQGMFMPFDGSKGKPGYNALWEYIRGRKLTYPKPRYTTPIIMRAANAPWVPVASGVAQKPLGAFSECGIAMGYLRLDAGASHMLRGPLLVFTLEGHGTCGTESFGAETAITLAEDERQRATAETEVTLFALRLPRAASAAEPAFDIAA